MEKSTRKVMRSQGRELICKVYQHMKYEAENGVERLTDARWRTSRATGVSERTITRILKEKSECDKTGTQMSSPHRNKKPRKRSKRDIDEYDKEEIKRIVSDFHRENKQYPTLKVLNEILTEKINFDGCLETLRRILLDLGCDWQTTQDTRQTLVEKLEFQCESLIVKEEVKEEEDDDDDDEEED